MPAATVQAPSPAVKNRTTTPTPSSQPSTRAFQGITPSIGKQAASATSWAQSAPPALRLSGGQPLSTPLRRRLEKSFRADLGGVRVHSDAHAAMKADQLGTKAFAIGQSIVLGSGASADDVGLMAHEAAHTLQQRSGGPLQRFTSGRAGDAHEYEAQRASAAAVRGESFAVQQQTGPRVQGFLGIDLPNPLNWLADKANIIPGFRMFTIILGVNPINMSPVARSAANILRALIEFLPGGGLITQALDSSGVFEKAGAFVEKQIATLGMAGSAIKAAVTAFISSLGLSDLANLGGVWERAKKIFTDPIDRIKSFGIGLVTGIVQIVKDAILRPIGKLAEGTEGYALLKAVMGKDPITGDPVPQTAEAIIGPFMKLIGQGEIWENMKKANAIPRAFAWFKGALSGLMGFVSQIPDLFIAAFKALELADIILVPLAFGKLVKVFGSFLGKFVSWAGDTIWNLLEIIFDVVSPGAFSYVKKTGAALKSILKNPLPFVGNLAKAAKLGFTNFADNILTHLKKGLIDWLTGSLEGVYIPKALTLIEFGKLALSVLGISWAQIRRKIVKALGPSGETIMQGLEAGFDVIKALVTGGPAAAWEVLKDKLTDLKDTIVGGIIDFVKDAVITKAIPKLIAMFIPGAGFISAIMSIYDMVKVFVEKISKIIQVVTAFINSIVAIAAGNIGAAAAKVESILGGLLSLAISFLAGFVSLGKVSDKVMAVVNKIRGVVDKALDTAIAWIVDKAKKLFGKAKAGAKALLQWWKRKVPFTGGGESHTLKFEGAGKQASLAVHSNVKLVGEFINDFLEVKGTAADRRDAKAWVVKITATQKLLVEAESANDAAKVESLSTSLDEQLKSLSTVLGRLLNSGETEGSAENPLPIDYPKRRASAYPIMYVGPRIGEGIRLNQEWLSELKGKSNEQAKKELENKKPLLKTNPGFIQWKGTVEAWPPNKQGNLGGKPIGLSPEFLSLAPGKVITISSKEGTGGGHKINDCFKPYGFIPSSKGGEGMDGDHVLERQLGGPDELRNLWPLDRSENRSSGATVKSLKVKFAGKETGVHEAREKSKKKVVFLLIRSTKG